MPDNKYSLKRYLIKEGLVNLGELSFSLPNEVKNIINGKSKTNYTGLSDLSVENTIEEVGEGDDKRRQLKPQQASKFYTALALHALKGGLDAEIGQYSKRGRAVSMGASDVAEQMVAAAFSHGLNLNQLAFSSNEPFADVYYRDATDSVYCSVKLSRKEGGTNIKQKQVNDMKTSFLTKGAFTSGKKQTEFGVKPRKTKGTASGASGGKRLNKAGTGPTDRTAAATSFGQEMDYADLTGKVQAIQIRVLDSGIKVDVFGPLTANKFVEEFGGSDTKSIASIAADTTKTYTYTTEIPLPSTDVLAKILDNIQLDKETSTAEERAQNTTGRDLSSILSQPDAMDKLGRKYSTSSGAYDHVASDLAADVPDFISKAGNAGVSAIKAANRIQKLLRTAVSDVKNPNPEPGKIGEIEDELNSAAAKLDRIGARNKREETDNEIRLAASRKRDGSILLDRWSKLAGIKK